MAEPERTLILVEPDGRAVLVRTPLARSIRFRSLADAERHHEGQAAGMLPMLVAGVLGSLAKVFAPDDLFLPLIAVILLGGVIASWAFGARAQKDGPQGEVLSWEESVAIDPRRHPLSRVGRDVGLALACAALLALVAVLVEEGGAENLEREGLLAQVIAGVFVVALMVGVGGGAWSATQRIRFHLARARPR